MGIEIKIGESFKEIADRTPTGVVSAYAGETAPTGWLVCDGTAVSRTTYADLFAVVGTVFGSGDGVNTFNLPDFRGEFLRGWADGSAKDPDRTSRTAMATGGATGDNIGSVQDGAILTHTHGVDHNHAPFNAVSGGAHSHTFAQGNAGSGSNPLRGTGDSGADTTTSTYAAHTHSIDVPAYTGASGNPSTGGGSETRPNNAYVNFIIKD